MGLLHARGGEQEGVWKVLHTGPPHPDQGCQDVRQDQRGVISRPYAWGWRRSRTCCATPVTWMLVTRSGPRALRPQRSGQLRRRCERAARGGRAGGEKLAGKATSVTVCWRQWAIHERRSWRPATSFHTIAASAAKRTGREDDLGDAPMSNGAHPPSTCAAGSPPQADRTQWTGRTVGILRHKDNKDKPLGKRVLLSDFRLPEPYPLGTA
jgi:hypothetical protein